MEPLTIPCDVCRPYRDTLAALKKVQRDRIDSGVNVAGLCGVAVNCPLCLDTGHELTPAGHVLLDVLKAHLQP